MSLNVIGSGFGRTGTMSLKLALEQLGLGRCHHMNELYEARWQAPHWAAASQGVAVDWQMLLEGYGACVDWPSAHFWRELAVAYPAAKVIHTTRSAESWWESYSETIMPFIAAGANLPEGIERDMSRWCIEIIGNQTFGADFTDRVAGLRAFDRRLAEVRDTIPKDRLLVFDVADGWAPLCEFLNLPVPDGPFPYTNDRSNFWQQYPTDT